VSEIEREEASEKKEEILLSHCTNDIKLCGNLFMLNFACFFLSLTDTQECIKIAFDRKAGTRDKNEKNMKIGPFRSFDPRQIMHTKREFFLSCNNFYAECDAIKS
jgi:hypothetical protein